MIEESIGAYLDDPIERDIVLRYTQTWAKMPRHRRTNQGWNDLLTIVRSEIERHRAELKAGRGSVDPA